jgi:hypothetical protein
MKQSLLLLALSLVIVLMISCGANPDMGLGPGGGNEGEARTVCGIIVSESGSGAGNISVRLLPVDYNPIAGDTLKDLSKKVALNKRGSAQYNSDSLKATTNQYGYFEIKNVPFNTYNLISNVDDSLSRKIFVKVVVDSSENPLLKLDTIHEKKPGHIQLTMLDSVAALNISLVVLGTGICIPVTHAGTYTISVPAGTLQVACMMANSKSGIFETIFLYDCIIVQENRMTLLGVSSNGDG